MGIQNPPEGYRSVNIYLAIDGAADAIEFYRKAFGAVEVSRLPMGDRLGHAEIRIGDTLIMLSDEFPEMNVMGPKSRGGPTASLILYVPDVDAAFEKAKQAGCTEERAPENQFWGDRMGSLTDPFGHKWSLATHVEDVSPEELRKRMDAFSGEHAA